MRSTSHHQRFWFITRVVVAGFLAAMLLVINLSAAGASQPVLPGQAADQAQEARDKAKAEQAEKDRLAAEQQEQQLQDQEVGAANASARVRVCKFVSSPNGGGYRLKEGNNGFVVVPLNAADDDQQNSFSDRPASYVVTDDNTTTCGGQLTVTKVILGDQAPTDAADTFEICIEATSPIEYAKECEELPVGGGSYAFTGLPGSTYSVTESTPPEGSGGAPDTTYSTSSVTITDGGVGSATVTNDYGDEPGSATITKTVSGSRAPAAGVYTICLTPDGVATVPATHCKTFNVNGEGTDVETWSNLAPGVYDLEETSATAGQQPSTADTTFPDTQVVTVTGGQTATAVVNAYGNLAGSATVAKTVTGSRAATSSPTRENSRCRASCSTTTSWATSHSPWRCSSPRG